MRALLAPLVVLAALGSYAEARPWINGAGGGSASELAPLTRDPIERWSFGPLTFESAPESWDRHVLVTGRDATGRRALVLLEAESGRVLSRTIFPSSVPLATAASGERVAVRTAPNRVD